eukprot:11141073-Alexandrium_andersonii.AAC.1
MTESEGGACWSDAFTTCCGLVSGGVRRHAAMAPVWMTTAVAHSTRAACHGHAQLTQHEVQSTLRTPENANTQCAHPMSETHCLPYSHTAMPQEPKGRLVWPWGDQSPSDRTRTNLSKASMA